MDTKILGEKVRLLRENRNLSQAEVALKLGIHRPSLSQVERGFRELSPEELLGLAQLFNITVDELLNTDNMPAKSNDKKNSSVMRITFIRHGEASDDIYNQYGGWADPELTPAGITKAYSVGNSLKKNHYDKIYVSPLRRAKKMGEIIASLTRVDLKVLQYLKERNSYGLLCGLNKDVAKRKYPELVAAYEEGKYVLASETVPDFEARVHLIFDYFKRNWNSSIIAVSHGGVLKTIAKDYLKMNISHLDDGAVLVTEFDGKNLFYITSEGVDFTR